MGLGLKWAFKSWRLKDRIWEIMLKIITAALTIDTHLNVRNMTKLKRFLN
jgi:hypothetical protein